MLYDGTTPTITLTFGDDQNVNLLSAKEVAVTLATDYGKILLEKTLDDIILSSNNSLHFALTQKETFGFDADTTVLIQVNILYPDGSRACSEIVKTKWYRNLKQEIMT